MEENKRKGLVFLVDSAPQKKRDAGRDLQQPSANGGGSNSPQAQPNRTIVKRKKGIQVEEIQTKNVNKDHTRMVKPEQSTLYSMFKQCHAAFLSSQMQCGRGQAPGSRNIMMLIIT